MLECTLLRFFENQVPYGGKILQSGEEMFLDVHTPVPLKVNYLPREILLVKLNFRIEKYGEGAYAG